MKRDSAVKKSYSIAKGLASVLIAGALFSCSGDDSKGGSGGGSEVYGHRTTFGYESGVYSFPWVAGDKIGIFSDGGVRNAPFTANSNGNETEFSGNMNRSGNNYYAYYPYNSSFSGSYTSLPVSVPSVQTQSAGGNMNHLRQYAFMAAYSQADDELDFSFEYLFSILEFKIIGEGNLSKIKLTAADDAMLSFPFGTVDLSDRDGFYGYTVSVMGGGSNSAELRLSAPAALNAQAGSTPSLFITVCNQGIETGPYTLTLTIDGTDEEVIIPNIIANRGLNEPIVVSRALEITASAAASGLAAAIDQKGWDREEITSLSLKGTMNALDFFYINDYLPNLTHLNLSEVTITAVYMGEGLSFPAGELLPLGGAIRGIVLPRNLKSIGNNAFSSSYLIELGNLTLPATLERIGDYAFEGRQELTGITLPANLKHIGKGAFRYCNQLQGGITIPDGLTHIGDYAFEECWNITGSLNFPNSVEYIGEGAFRQCHSLNGSLVLPANPSFTEINTETFMSTGLTGTLTIPGNVRDINYFAFNNCPGFTGSLSIPNSVRYIAPGAFAGCSGFNGTLKLPDNDEFSVISNEVFYGCSGFTGTLAIPENITSMGEYSFSGCSGFSDIKFSSHIPLPMDNLIGLPPGNKPIYVPEASVLTYKSAWPGLSSLISGY